MPRAPTTHMIDTSTKDSGKWNPTRLNAANLQQSNNIKGDFNAV